jgi:DNA-binding LacI/PurR family transcriptional regulator
VPEDIALAGFDDLPLAERSDPPLTTIRQPIHRTGTTAVETLIELIEHPNGAPHRVVLPTELVVGVYCVS